VVVDGTGKHVTPGLIDPHTHAGVSSVNESGFAIVPEVQMGDVLTHNNIWMYRQLAGGLTTQMVKHGSANPIGGENVFVKNALGFAARRPQDRGRAAHREVRARRKPEAQPDALSQHAHGCAGDHP
jgi:imidazolonepropionase-like amidohydrolase